MLSLVQTIVINKWHIPNSLTKTIKCRFFTFFCPTDVPWCIGVWISMPLTETIPPCFSFTVMSSSKGKLSVTERVHTASWSSAHWNVKVGGKGQVDTVLPFSLLWRWPKVIKITVKWKKKLNYLYILDNDRKLTVCAVSCQQVLAATSEGEELVVKGLEVRLAHHQALAYKDRTPKINIPNFANGITELGSSTVHVSHQGSLHWYIPRNRDGKRCIKTTQLFSGGAQWIQ